MPFAVITVDRIDRQENNYIHFFDKSQKAWNCNVVDLFEVIVPGERVVIDYNENPPAAGRKYGTKYVNRARLWQEGDGDNTWPDKEQYTGGQSGGNKVKKDDYDPTVGKRQTASNVSGPIVLELIKNLDDKDKLDAFKMYFPVVADVVFDWVNASPKSGADGTMDTSGETDSGSGGFKF